MKAARSPPRSEPTKSHDFRPSALQRKNALFAGHAFGAENWTAIASLVETCKLNDVNPTAYLTDLVPQLASRADGEKIDDLLPARWAKAHAGRSPTSLPKSPDTLLWG